MNVSNEIIKDVAGMLSAEDTINIIFNIKDKVNVSEFKIAEDLHLEIRDIRKKLYKLLENNLVTFKRKKDKKKGWYIYYWTFNPVQAKFLYTQLRERKLKLLQERLEREKNNQFFICPNACVRLDFEKAFEFDFKCPECGSLVKEHNNEATIRNLEEEIERLKKELAEIKEKKFRPAKEKTIEKKGKREKENEKRKETAKSKTGKRAKISVK
ncbi:MAG: hypothetical protein ACP5OZ_05335, partial [Candidatus Woesearchaeota archaeon]